MIAYVKHRSWYPGEIGDEYTDSALNRILHAKGRRLRLVNQVCERAMTYAFAGGETHVDHGLVKQLIDDDVLLGVRQIKVLKVK